VKSQWPPQGLATSHYTNPRVEQLVDQAAHAAGNQQRQDAYAEAQRIIWDDAPWIFLWVPSTVLVHAARLKGISSLPNEKFSTAYAEPT
jgi:peptide/nickel transport system substrate-binding protein